MVITYKGKVKSTEDAMMAMTGMGVENGRMHAHVGEFLVQSVC